MSIEGIPIDLTSEIPQCLDLDGNQNKLTFQQLMLSGYPIAKLEGITQPNPITAVSRGMKHNTYIISAYRANVAGLRAVMMHVMPSVIPMMFLTTTFDHRFKCNVRPATSTRY